MPKFASVILPLPVEGTFTYAVPEALADGIGVGYRVIVPFGKRHFYTGLVSALSDRKPEGAFNVKEIVDVLDASPIVRPTQIRFWEWLAEYYLCTVGEVFKAALPSGLKVESETRLSVDSEVTADDLAALTPDQQTLVSFVAKEGSVNLDGIAAKAGVTGAGKLVSRLVEQGILCVSEKLVERYRSVKRHYVRVTLDRGDTAAVDAAFAALKRSPKQEEALMALIAISGFYRHGEPLVEVPVEVLMERADVSRAIVKALVDRGYAEFYVKEISRFSFTGEPGGVLPQLSEAQTKALDRIHYSFKEKDIVLLHGVTGSGKTEVYMHLIDYVLERGRQALFLVPEIALTTQLTRRLQRVFGGKVLIYHSKFSDNERVDIWRKLLTDDGPCVVIGARSAVFLPFRRLGLVIVDEEHEASYKQYDPAPRYNGRDAAVVLASMHGAKTLYGSATPSVETYHKALTGKFGLVTLDVRYGDAALPAIEIVDMKAERGKRAVAGYFSHRLLDATLDALAGKKQAILFHNRRGYAPLARCKMCAHTPKCDYCDVSLTYHKRRNRLVCHYCGTEYPVPELCPECKEPAIEIVGYGTERLEDEINANFRDKRVLRMDLDTTRNKEGYSKIIDEFSAHKADILVGTQMVTKGLDFGDVALVGVLNADSLINFPDFRSAERAFNMIEQVAGRAGRRDGKGRVLIQTYTPDHPVLSYASAHDYTGFYEHELEERRAYCFPPFARIINIYLKHRDPAVVAECASKFAAALRSTFGQRVSPPKEPAVNRVQALYIRQIMLKMEPGVSMKRVKELLRGHYVELSASPLMRGLTVYYDVDPV
ncbi:MAG: primosomal protein N' [Muribaculaceae bacterium]|nr:primosomal protein N' [Muribaculaceae bacterium]